MTRWFRFYTEALDDPKVQLLPPATFKAWVNILCLAAKDGGKLPNTAAIAFALRLDLPTADHTVQALLTAGLLDDMPDGLRPHNWNSRQFVSDLDPTAAERQRRKRLKDQQSRDVTRDSHAMSHRPDTDTEQKQKEDAREARGPRLSFFPKDGSVAFSPWAALSRQHAKGLDPDYVANRFRGFCSERSIDLADRSIEKVFVTFAGKMRQRA